MTIQVATNVITALLHDSMTLTRHRLKGKSFVEFDWITEDDGLVIYLRPVSSFGKCDMIGVHTKAESKDELIYQLGNAIETATKDNFSTIHVYCLPEDYLNTKTDKKQLA